MEAIVMIEEAGKVPISKLLWPLAQCGIVDHTGRDLFSLVVIVRGVVIFFG